MLCRLSINNRLKTLQICEEVNYMFYVFLEGSKYIMKKIFTIPFMVLILLTNVSALADADTLLPGPKDNGELYSQEHNQQEYCMAMNIYHEARGDNLAGKYAVADVVLNRVQDTRYPNTICEVVMEGPVKESWKTKQDPNLPDDQRVYNPVRNRCQFSWWCDGRDDTPYNLDRWRESQEIAYMIITYGNYRGIAEGATHYHATYVNPSWNKRMQHVGRIGEHLFFRSN